MWFETFVLKNIFFNTIFCTRTTIYDFGRLEQTDLLAPQKKLCSAWFRSN